MVGSVEPLQPLFCVGETDTLLPLALFEVRDSGSVVTYLKYKATVVAARADSHVELRRLRISGVTNRVLHQRLKNELRHESLGQSWINREIHAQILPETLFHDSEVAFQQLQLLFERDLLGVCCAQRAPQQVAQVRQHGVGMVYIFVHY